VSLRMLKYPLFDLKQPVLDDTVVVSAPPWLGSQHVAMQGGVLTLWVLVDDEAEAVDRTFTFVGTGHKVSRNVAYMGSVMDRIFVWHLFEVFPEAAA
jgi:hypothetical protein